MASGAQHTHDVNFLVRLVTWTGALYGCNGVCRGSVVSDTELHGETALLGRALHDGPGMQ